MKLDSENILSRIPLDCHINALLLACIEIFQVATAFCPFKDLLPLHTL